ncbi:MAG: alpha/beta fold hydrolase [Brevundimonas sp.]
MPVSDVTVSDHLIPTPSGTLFARRWSPVEGADRPAIILFHDSLGCVELWRDFPERLASATGCSVVAYDRLGFGRSDAHPATLSIDFMRDEASTSLPALLADLMIDRFIAFGHSVGGAMAVSCAAAWPDACAAVITESAQAFVEDRTLHGIREAKANFADPAQVARLARYHGDKAPWVLDAWIETWLAPAFAGWTMDAELAQLACPLLAIHGDLDEFGSLAHPRRIIDQAGSGGTQLILQSCGHVPHREQVDDVLKAIRAFLIRMAPAPSS